jgi:hypothetical protein
VSETPESKESRGPWLKYGALKAEAEAHAKYCSALKDYIRLVGDGHPNTLPADFFVKKDYYEQNCEPRKSAQSNYVDCYDSKGNLVPDPYAEFGGFIVSCALGQTAKPRMTK